MENLSWLFDGIGTQIITFLVGTITGGVCGYKIGIHNYLMQRPSFGWGGVCGYKIGIHNKTKQSQKAGNNSSQTQIGSINYGSNK